MLQRSAFTCLVATAVMFGCAPAQNSPATAAPPPARTVSTVPDKPPPSTDYDLSPKQKRDMYMGCWSFFNTRKLEKIVGCYHENATFEIVGSQCPVVKGPAAYLQRLSDFLLAFPDAKAKLQLTLAHDDTVVGVALIRGTHTGPLQTPEGEIPATNKSVGFLFGHVVKFDKNRIVKDLWFRDPHTVLSQIGASKVKGRAAISESAEETPDLSSAGNRETTSVGVFNNYFAALNTHDLARVEPMLDSDFVYSNQIASKDYSGSQGLKYQKDLLGAFSDLKIEHSEVFGVGDYAIGFSTLTGTNDGPLRAWNLWKGSRRPVSLQGLDILWVFGGKVKQHWAFADGQALAEQLGVVDAPPAGSGCSKQTAGASEADAEGADVDADAETAPPAKKAEPKK